MSRLMIVPLLFSLFAAIALAAAPAGTPPGTPRGPRGAAPPAGSDAYVLGPDSKEQPGVPKGKLTAATITSKIYPDRVFNYQVYVPAQYDGTKPAALMVFQNGTNYVRAVIPGTNRPGAWRIDLVLDNLIHKKDIPLIIGVFIDPTDNDGPQNVEEYASLDGKYAKFVIEEVMGAVGKQYNITADPDGHATSGFSFGGICAFTMAWERPDYFRKAVSCFGNFLSTAEPSAPATSTAPAATAARGDQPKRGVADTYAALIRETPIKPLKLYFQDGAYDTSNQNGSAFVGNKQMVAALEWANKNADTKGPTGPRYQVEHAWGDGGHTANHGASIYPDILRWLWKGYEPK